MTTGLVQPPKKGDQWDQWVCSPLGGLHQGGDPGVVGAGGSWGHHL